MKDTKIGAIILAAGFGTRLNQGQPSIKPKVLFELADRPMISYTISNLKALDPTQMIIVVGFKGQMVRKILGNNYLYAYQKNPIGTADAVLCGLKKLAKKIRTVIIVNGDDSAFYKTKTLQDLIKTHFQEKNSLTFLTLKLDDPSGLGRVVRDKDGKVRSIAEEKAASRNEKKIKEINVGCYVAAAGWLESVLPHTKKSKTGEYFLVDIVKIAVARKDKIGTVSLKNRSEWQGINTPDELKLADSLMRKNLNA